MSLRRRVLTILAAILVALAVYARSRFIDPVPPQTDAPPSGEVRGEPPTSRGQSSEIQALFRERRSGVVVEDAGRVDRILADDREGSRHQRFVLRLPSGDTVLVAHNIDLAPRVPIEVGDAVEFRGEYEWNERGGVIHWTHHDPRAQRPGGWIRVRGETFR